MAKEKQDNYKAFEGLNLNNARSENETRKQYKARLKQNDKILKLYYQVGRDAFKEMFPVGVGEALRKQEEENNKHLQEYLKKEEEKKASKNVKIDGATIEGVEIEKSAIRLPGGALKDLGEFQVDIEFHPEVIETVSVSIVSQE